MSQFDQIFLSPGLYWISEYIFLDLIEDNETFAKLELVCKTWHNYFILNELWRKRLELKIAKKNSYKAVILKKHKKKV